MNTRWDHVELNELTTLDDDAVIACTRQQLQERLAELDARRVFYTYTKDCHGISTVRTRGGARVL